MHTLSRSVFRGGVSADPLPVPFQSWKQYGIRFHRASLSMLFGPSASFKTMVLMNALINMRVPTLAFSTDSDQNTVAARLAARATNQPYEATRGWIRSEPKRMQRILQATDYIRWDFTPGLDMDHIWNSMYAYAEVEGRYPEQVTVDLLSDIWHSEGSDDWSRQKAICRELKALARETGAHVLVVTHATEGRCKTPVPAKGDIQGKLDLLPELIIACGIDWQGDLRVTSVKNRHARSDPHADRHFPMSLNPEFAWVGDYTPPAAHIQHHYTEDEEP